MIQVMSTVRKRETPAGAGDGASEVLTTVETELAVLTRWLEGMSRKSRVYERLDRSGYLLARTLDGRGPMTIGALAAVLGLDATTVTRQVAAMDADGLVRRTKDPRDGRACVVELTPTGVRRMTEVRDAREARVAVLLGDWTDEERRALGDSLARFNAAIRADQAR